MTKLGFFPVVVLAAACLLSQFSPAQTLAPTPPLGWNSWDAYGFTIDEEQFRDNATVLASLQQFGWKYAVIDEGWYMANPAGKTLEQKQYLWNSNGLLIPGPGAIPVCRRWRRIQASRRLVARAGAQVRHSHRARHSPTSGRGQFAHRRHTIPCRRRRRHIVSMPLGRWQLGRQGQCRGPGLLRLDAEALCALGSGFSQGRLHRDQSLSAHGDSPDR